MSDEKMWTLIVVASLLSGLVVYLAQAYWKLRRDLLAAQEVAQERKVMLETVTLTSQKAASASAAGVSDDDGPAELPPVDDSIVSAIVKGECVLFAGSGVSAQAGLPVWHQTLAAVIEQFERRDEQHSWAPVSQMLMEGRPDIVADLISSRVPRQELLRALADLYKARSTRSLPQLSAVLADLPFARVLTPNWDTVVEETFRKRDGLVLSPDRSDSFAAVFRENVFMILKLYGDLAKAESVSVSPEEYRRSVEDNPQFFKFVSSIYSSNSILFLGASLAGIEDFVSGLRLRNPSRVHHALVPWQHDFEAQQERFHSKYGIHLLPFRPTPGFPEVVRWTSNLLESCRERPVPAPQVSIRQQSIKRLELENIGSFETFGEDLNAGWNLLLGNNGVGKSTILKAIAMGFCGADPKAAKAAAGLLRAGESKGAIRLWLADDVYESRLKRSGQDVLVECDRYTPFQSGTLVALGFPPLRGVSLRNPQGARPIEAPNPVIEDVLPLLLGSVDTRVDNLKQWLVNVQTRIDSSSTPPQEKERAAQMRDTFFRIMDELSPGVEVRFDHVNTRTWQVMVLTQDGVIPIDQLSQGVTSLLGWVGALLERMYEIHTSSSYPEQQPGLLSSNSAKSSR